jgi:hypothetical protein|tara:strand:- start:541 stop:1029 length:489 start_codon:yes stop_codon:yes gene_type:complete
MIYQFKSVNLFIALFFILFAFTKAPEEVSLKCMIQMTNYKGEAAYVIISLIDPNGDYEKTLHVRGQDSEWFSEIYEWWKFYGQRRPNIDAISGATIGGGERTISIINIDSEKINSGYSIRFETAVEDQEYFKEDVQFKLTTESVSSQVNGKGFIRYVRVINK